MDRLSIVPMCAVFALAGCGGQGPTSPGSPSVEELRAAPTEITVSGRTLTLDTSLWRDFMPISPPDGRPLAAVMRIKARDGSAVPATIHSDRAFVVFGTELWSAVPEERSRADTAPIFELAARDGPKWGPGVSVDVVVRLTDGSGGVFLLRAPSQPILGAF